MSRFYDAMKRAGQSVKLPQENAEAAKSDALNQADVADILATFDATERSSEAVPREGPPEPASRATDPLGPPEMPTVEGITPLERSFPFRSDSRNGSFGTLVQTQLENRVRLIPNLVDLLGLEQYRFLQTKILQQQADQMFRTLLVTSPNPEEGKTLTTLNLALTFTMLPSYKVLVVEGDLRKGNLKNWLGIHDRPGLGNLIEGSASLEEVVCRSSEIPISFVVRGNSKLSAPELLHSQEMSIQLQEMAKHFDLVLVDSPPVNLVTDAQLLAASCDAVLLVVRSFFTSQDELEDAAQKLRRFRVLGTMLNGRPMKLSDYRYRSN